MKTQLVTYPYHRATINIIGEVIDMETISILDKDFKIVTVSFGLNEKIDIQFYAKDVTFLKMDDNVEVMGSLTMTNHYHRKNKYDICEKLPHIVGHYIRKIGTANELYPDPSSTQKEIARTIEGLSKNDYANIAKNFERE